MTGGAAAADFNGDGFTDIFFVNGAEIPSLQKTGPKFWNRLYRNDAGKGFTDITEAAGLKGEGYAMGAAAADFNNDGLPDLFVAAVNGASRLYKNEKGKFREVAIPPVPGWAVAAGWFDYDRDGHLDLLIVKYLAWNPATEPSCVEPVPVYCHPREFAGLPNQLFRNNGDGTFTDVSQQTGIAKYTGKGMSVAFGDIDNDGYPDAFVTNDTVPNFLLHNRNGKTFEDIAVRAGVAVNDDGRALSGMGVDFRDVDNDGRDDLFYTALINETFPLLKNLGKLLFQDITYASRVGAATLRRSGWGAGIYDFDNDGRKDLFAAGGDVQSNAEQYSSRASRQPNILLWNRAEGKFEPQDIGTPALHRGTAFADFDNDGAIDAVITRLGETPFYWKNTPKNHWIGFRTNKLGTRVSIDGEQYNHATAASGYASSSDPRIHFGLGSKTAVKEVTITWPSGKVQKLANPAIDRYLDIAEP
ncbi:RNA-binding protein [Bryobacterales bacterium F-183]|nr:RNA-binding protein [Bryobacterales bacterium F-183]